MIFFRGPCWLWVAYLCASPPLLSAQARTGAYSDLAGLSLSGLETKHPEGGILATGFVLGLERRLREGVGIRGVATVSRGNFFADGIALCHPTPTGCLPDAIFPTWILSASIEGALTPRRGWPLRLLAGGGGVYAANPKENQRKAPSLPLPSVLRASWRAGFEIPLGSSRRAPALQLTHMGFGSGPFSISAVDVFAIVLRP